MRALQEQSAVAMHAALVLCAVLPLIACGSPSPVADCRSTGQAVATAYQACTQAQYARQMQQLNDQARLELRARQ